MARDTSPVRTARTAIWRLFEDGYVDDDMATASLLAIDLGLRRVQRGIDAPELARRNGRTPPRRAA